MMENPFALLIVDSLMAPFRVDFSGRGQLADWQQMLGKILNKLLKLAQAYNTEKMRNKEFESTLERANN